MQVLRILSGSSEDTSTILQGGEASEPIETALLIQAEVFVNKLTFGIPKDLWCDLSWLSIQVQLPYKPLSQILSLLFIIVSNDHIVQIPVMFFLYIEKYIIIE